VKNHPTRLATMSARKRKAAAKNITFVPGRRQVELESGVETFTTDRPDLLIWRWGAAQCRFTLHAERKPDVLLIVSLRDATTAEETVVEAGRLGW
jgi:hypothetical protein